MIAAPYDSWAEPKQEPVWIAEGTELLSNHAVALHAEGMEPRLASTVEINGEPLTCFHGDAMTFFYGKQGWDTFPIRLLKAILQPGMVCVDAGAHIGWISRILSRRVGESGLVHSFEPDPMNYALLAENIESIGIENVATYPFALSDTEGEERLCSQLKNTGDNRLWRNDENMHTRKHSGDCRVVARPLDNVLIPGARVDFIKIDTQGWEPKVLRGMKRTLAQQKQIVLMVEFWPKGIESAGMRLEELAEGLEGFLVFGVTEDDCVQFIGTPWDLLDVSPYAFPDLLCFKGPTRDVLQRIERVANEWRHP